MQVKLCATICILRPKTSSYEILLIKRSNHLSFPGVFTAPGGKHEFHDASLNWLAYLGIPPEVVPATLYTQEIDLTALKITALRETFEETGVFLGNGKIRRTESGFFHNCVAENVRPSIGQLHYFARYVSPELLKQRFDTVYFMCISDCNEQIVLDKRECSDYMWGSPQDFLNEYKRKHIWLYAPQIYILSLMSRYETLGKLFTCELNKIPLMAQIGIEGKNLYYPGDYRHCYTDFSVVGNGKIHELDLCNASLRIDATIEQWLAFKELTRTCSDLS